ncbi:MAG TPA: metal-sensitive transcriptional regulator [Streptosporangiaceae bacterium]
MTSVTPFPGRGAAGECSPPRRTGAAQRAARGYASGKDDYLARLRKIEGQVRGLQRMIEADTWCPDVVVQVASATRALQEVASGLLNDHLRHCVASAASRSDAEADAAFAEVASTIRQVIRL